MPVNQFLILCFSESDKSVLDQFAILREAGHQVRLINRDRLTLKSIISELKSEERNRRVILVSDVARIRLSKNIQTTLKHLDFSDAVLFAASPWFVYSNSTLHYYYWKHYTRPHSLYNYLDSTLCYGTAAALMAILEGADARYPAVSHGFQDAITRYYVDVTLGCVESDYDLLLDHNQEYFTSTVWSTLKRSKGWLFDHLYKLNEDEALSNQSTGNPQHLQNIELIDGSYHNTFTGSSPGFLAFDNTAGEDFRLSFRDVLSIWKKTITDLLFIAKINRGVFSKEGIFRWRVNQSNELTEGTLAILDRLEGGLPLSFAHYNDGELTFIRDYIAGNHHEKWFGRQQQQYDPLLAERLYEAMKYKKEGYFIGVPCSIDHGKLREEADEIVGDYEYKVQAMSIHHNLYFMPRILEALKGRTVYFFTNEFQDLSFFSQIGVKVDAGRVFKVPYKNSYLEYDNYKDIEFPEGAVVVLTCGMLAKILTKVWFHKNDHLSVLALGASLDDHLQKDKSGLELFPSQYPVTRNIKKYRAFLFGPKKRCKECFDF